MTSHGSSRHLIYKNAGFTRSLLVTYAISPERAHFVQVLKVYE